MERALVIAADAENPDVGDLLLEHGRTVLTSVLAEEVAQRLHVRFNFWKQEWFRDTRLGTPYLEAIFEKGVPDSTIRSVYTQIILGTEGVASLDSLSWTVGATRKMSLTFTARLQDGTTFRSSQYGPFIVRLDASGT